MAVGDIWQMAVIGRQDNEDRVNVLHIRMKSGSGTPEGAADVAAINVMGVFRTVQVDDYVVALVRGRQLVGGDGALERTYSPVLQGNSTGDPLPSQIALCASLKTGFAGRRNRGRIYPSSFSEGFNVGGIPLAGDIATLQSNINVVVGLYGAGGSNADYEWGIFSRVNGGTLIDPGPPPVYGPPWNAAGFKAISEVVIRPFWATQRKRRLGVGS
jgi:hypothetical protein